jgi:thiol:disulfide interchange protein
MRSMVLIFLLSAALVGVWLMKSKPAAAEPTAQPTRQTSDHNWAKNALDRTAELKKQVAQQRREDGTR